MFSQDSGLEYYNIYADQRIFYVRQDPCFKLTWFPDMRATCDPVIYQTSVCALWIYLIRLDVYNEVLYLNCWEANFPNAASNVRPESALTWNGTQSFKYTETNNKTLFE